MSKETNYVNELAKLFYGFIMFILVIYGLIIGAALIIGLGAMLI